MRAILFAVLVFVALPAPAAPDPPSPKAFTEGEAVRYAIRTSDPFGIRVAPLPDLDRDGIADLAVGAFSLESDSSPLFTSGDVSIHSGRDGARLHLVAPIGSTRCSPTRSSMRGISTATARTSSRSVRPRATSIATAAR